MRDARSSRSTHTRRECGLALRGAPLQRKARRARARRRRPLTQCRCRLCHRLRKRKRRLRALARGTRESVLSCMGRECARNPTRHDEEDADVKLKSSGSSSLRGTWESTGRPTLTRSASGRIRAMRVEDEGERGPECRGRRPAADTCSASFPSLGPQHSCTPRSHA
jgi:hypothetical protein